MHNICVFCSSSEKIDPVYFEVTEELARLFVAEDIQVVFGGADMGLMRQLADTVIQCGGRIKGVMPKFMVEIEWAHPGVKDFVFTDTMSERMDKYLEASDGLVALPGGCGTLEELLHVITLKRLGLFTGPIVILNINKYFDPLHEMLNKCVAKNFMVEEHLNMWTFVDEPEEVIDSLKVAPAWTKDALHFSANV